MGDAGIATAQALRLHNELHVISITFLYWDHLLTFGDEVQFLWRKTKTRSAYYFFLNRYLACFGNVVITVFQFTAMPISVCPHINLFRQLLLVLTQCIVSVLLTLRIYALYSRRVYLGMLGFAAVLLGLSCWALIGRRGGVPEPNAIGCHIANSRKIGVYTAVPWEALLIYDLVIFVALFHKSLQKRRVFRALRRSNVMLSVLMRDGAIYFVIMTLVNLGNIITFYIAPPLLRGGLSTMASCMSVTMTSRLMLNLHTVDRAGVFSATSRINSSLEFGSGDVELDTLRTRDLEWSAPGPAHVPPSEPE
ncbi:hypothetical protein B0H17DRAFT_329215 [Mycena rosella]|uniref:DUF6533 domain-containing protein n=1 Tax=Mycena rosella TaxID=1033263 RepID=A0AAD7CSS0_MYCRO|nr:hypothetical protein B0H17DRAFT_329215 [Mycena rosella]